MADLALFCWSGGKDSALALHALSRNAEVRVASLLATVTEGYDRVSMHGVRRELLHRQAESLRLPLHEVFIPPQCVNPIYETRMEEAMRHFLAKGIRKVAFGDIFLEDLRRYRENNLARVEMQAVFPIWKRDTRELGRDFQGLGFCAVAVCIDSGCSIPASLAANSTRPSSPLCRRTSIRAGKTANFTLLSSTAPSSLSRFLSPSAKKSKETASFFAICCRQRR